MKRVKVLKGYRAHAIFLCSLKHDAYMLDGVTPADGSNLAVAGYVPRQPDIPSPYAYSPAWPVFQHPEYGLVLLSGRHTAAMRSSRWSRPLSCPRSRPHRFRSRRWPPRGGSHERFR